MQQMYLPNKRIDENPLTDKLRHCKHEQNPD